MSKLSPAPSFLEFVAAVQATNSQDKASALLKNFSSSINLPLSKLSDSAVDSIFGILIDAEDLDDSLESSIPALIENSADDAFDDVDAQRRKVRKLQRRLVSEIQFLRQLEVLENFYDLRQALELKRSKEDADGDQ